MVRSFALTVLTVVFSLALSSCGEKDTHQKIMTDNLVLMGQVATILEDVKDDNSAQSAAIDLEGLIEQFDVIAERTDAIGKPDAETESTLNKAFEKQRAEIHKRLTSASTTAKETGNKALLETLDRLGKSWSKIH